MPIPEGITFGSKVAVLPGFASGFTHSAEIVSLMKGHEFCWIKRGTPIGEIIINGSLSGSFLAKLTSSKPHRAAIFSPVSGLLLHTTIHDEPFRQLLHWNDMTEPPLGSFAVLLAENESTPESGEYMYSDACRLVLSMKHYYLKKSRQWGMDAFSSNELDELIETQLSANPILFDASPNWDNYLHDARIEKPELQPLLKHMATR